MAGETTSYTLGDLVDLSQGLAINAKTSHLISDFGTPLLRITDLINGTRCQFVDVAKVPQQCVVTPEEIIYTRTGQVGLVFKGKRGVAHNNCFKVAPKSELLDSEYLYWFLSQESVREHANAIASGSVQKDLNHTAFKSIPIELPCLQTQRAVTPILNSIADKIELNRQMNATLEAMARALFQSWFVDFDPVRAKLDGRKPIGLDEPTAAHFPQHLEDSPLGHIPKGWEVKTVGDIGDVICGKTPPTSVADYYGEDMPFITIPDMHGNVFGAATVRKLSQAGANSQANKTLPPGSLCVSCIATPGLVVITSEDSQTNQQINSVVPHQKEETYFWYWVMVSLRAEIASSGSGGSVLVNLSKGRFETLQVIKPPHALIRIYHTTVRPLFETILANTHQSRTLATLRDTLLPKLLSGELSTTANLLASTKS